VALVLTEIAQGRELPTRIQADNGPELISISLHKWAYDHGVTMDFSRHGKPTDHPFIESFNGNLRDAWPTRFAAGDRKIDQRQASTHK
jgi:transposase InsO family protein